jgi:DNA repair exonuclease SbcCD nuclease subunit
MLSVPVGIERINLVWSTDWHLSAVPPGRRADDYLAAILAKLEFVRQVTEKVQGVALCGGDVFHIKSARHPANSLSMLALVTRALGLFQTGRVYGAVGNHDLAWGERMDSLPGQPLGVLLAAGAYYPLWEDPVLVRNGPSGLGLAAQVESFPYGHAEETLGRIMASRRHPDARWHVGIVHAYGGPEGGSYWGERVIGYDQVAGSDFDFLLWGHDHGRKGIEKVGSTVHVQLGSLARAALDTDQEERPVAIVVVSLAKEEKDNKVREIAVPVKPLEEVFTVADRGVRKVEKSDEMKRFFAGLEEKVGGIEAADPTEALKELCRDDPRLLALVRELCGL